jgi:hypothetical protein
MKKQSRMPLKTLADALAWSERSINEAEPNSTSIAQTNARTACIKTLYGGFRLALDYAKLVRQGAKIKEMANFVQLDQAALNPGESKAA